MNNSSLITSSTILPSSITASTISASAINTSCIDVNLRVDGVDIVKEIKNLKQSNDIFKKILIMKNICTEEEIDNILASIEIANKLIGSE